MQTQPIVSFIIPAYNIDAIRIQECIGSILDLSLSRLEREIILIDDGSKTPAINSLNDLADDIIYIRQRHMGCSQARNLGIKMATGRFIQFVNGESLLTRAPYEHCLDIVRYHDPDIVTFLPNDKDDVMETPFTYAGPSMGSEYMRNNTICMAVCSFIFERSILGSLRFATDTQNGEEEFTPQLFLRSERLYTTDAKAYHICPKKNVTYKDDKNQQYDSAETERILIYLRSLVVPETDRLALNRQIAILTMTHLQSIIRYTRSRKKLKEAMDRLERQGLYPLPDRNYTKEYMYFRKMIGNKFTRRLLFILTK